MELGKEEEKREDGKMEENRGTRRRTQKEEEPSYETKPEDGKESRLSLVF